MPSPHVTRQLIREINQLRQDPPEGIRISTNEENMLDLIGIIEGPAGTPYEGGYFRVKFHFTDDFPNAPPKCHFITKLFHPNVSSGGEICVNTLKKDWQPSFGISHILVTIKCLLIYPNPESALDEEAGKLLLEDYTAFEKRAKLICEVHATPKTRPPEFKTPAPSRATSTAPTELAPLPTTASPARKTSPAPSSMQQQQQQSSKVTSIANLSKSVPSAPVVAITPFQPSVNASPMSNSMLLPNVLQPSGNVTGLSSSETAPSSLGSALPSAVSGGKTSGKRVSSTAAGGVEKKKKALKRL
ncbi:hypothetical protein M422DRAFT_785297 [Sphaerobolus stellatus SS14]|uniref:E2 ubiquitin-conjugating enzyme n=1 Tax=Sphaerobolus stellatus (strain SS14) TaxID=990650 RepID=A0A0C9UAV3_SPHS4|nr:hypothetical protein M422DRAFT_785297 [Sphaerobolus stellatus SS14]